MNTLAGDIGDEHDDAAVVDHEDVARSPPTSSGSFAECETRPRSRPATSGVGWMSIVLQDSRDALLLGEEPGVLLGRRLREQSLFVQLLGEHAGRDRRRGSLGDDLEEPLLAGVGTAPLTPSDLDELPAALVVQERRSQEGTQAALGLGALDEPARARVLDEKGAAQLGHGSREAHADRRRVLPIRLRRRNARDALEARTTSKEYCRSIGAHRRRHLAHDGAHVAGPGWPV